MVDSILKYREIRKDYKILEKGKIKPQKNVFLDKPVSLDLLEKIKRIVEENAIKFYEINNDMEQSINIPFYYNNRKTIFSIFKEYFEDENVFDGTNMLRFIVPLPSYYKIKRQQNNNNKNK